MSDWKSKLPDMNELTSMSTKLFKGVKDAVVEIVDDYKKKRENEVKTTEVKTEAAPVETKAEVTTEATSTEKAEEEKKE